MKDKIIANLKLIYQPKEEYFGEWELTDLLSLAIIKNNKNSFYEYLERFYYGPLKIIFKDEELVYDFKYAVCSSLNDSGRRLYFSKKAFLRNIVSNIDDLIKYNGEEFYKKLKHELRIKKDMYRDVFKLDEESEYYSSVKNEYLLYGPDMSFQDYVQICKKKYTNLLSGYNTFLDFIDRPLDINSFIKCFDENKLYLYTMYCLFNKIMDNYNSYGKLDFSLTYLDDYKALVKEIRKKEKFYNTFITIMENDNKKVITIDDLLKKYERFLKNINE